MSKSLTTILMSYKLKDIDTVEAIRRINQHFDYIKKQDVLTTIHDNLIDKGFDCYNNDGSLKEVDEYKLTFKDVRIEIEKYLDL